MGIVLSQQFELQRQLDMIEWSENFLRLQRSVLPPADYLAAWYASVFGRLKRAKLSTDCS